MNDSNLWEKDAKSPLLEEGLAVNNSSKRHWIFWIGGATVLIILIAILLFMIFSKPNKPSVSVDFGNISQILAGESFTLPVSFSNDSNQVIKNARLSIIIPDGVSFIGRDPSQRVIDEVVGDLGPGSLGQKSYDLLILGSGQTIQRIDAKLRYSTENGSKAEFSADNRIDISVGEPVVGLNISAPENVFSGESFDMTVNYKNNSSNDIKNLNLKIDYPPNFQLENTETNPDKDNNVWNIISLAKGESKTIKIRGNIIGPEKSFFSFNGTITSNISGQNYSLINQNASVGISSSPISLQISINDNSSDFLVHLKDNLHYTLRYKNNTNSALENINIRATLTGELFDFAQIQTNAFFSSVTNTFSWSVANTPSLTNLEPGQEGTVDILIRVKDSFPIRRLSDKNYTLKLQSQIESASVPGNTAAKKTISIAGIENKVVGNIQIDAQALFRDAKSEILNSGPYPPQVNQSTQYTVHWIITNFANDASNVQVSSFLQSGSIWTGKVKSNIESVPVYEPATGKVTWSIDSIAATKGIISAPIEAIFQISNTPAVNQVGQDVTILNSTNLTAQDQFTGAKLSSSDSPLTTAIPDDKTITDYDKRVRQ
jgi:hypothetical protein